MSRPSVGGVAVRMLTLIVEDTHIDGNPDFGNFGPGPHEAVIEFLKEHPEFESDRSKERFLMTFNPRGFLRRH